MLVYKFVEKLGNHLVNEMQSSVSDYAEKLIKKNASEAVKKITKNEEIIQLAEQLFTRLPELLFSSLSVSSTNTEDQYFTVITEDSNHPFPINDQICRLAKKITRGETSETEKAKKIFSWITENITYGANRKKVGYRNANEVLNAKEGVCGEQAILFVTLCRASGIKARYVSVTKDCFGKEVNHACAAIYIKGAVHLVDLTYFLFKCNHQRYAILSDEDAVNQFKVFRGNN